MELKLETLDQVEAPVSNVEGALLTVIAVEVGVIAGLLIT